MVPALAVLASFCCTDVIVILWCRFASRKVFEEPPSMHSRMANLATAGCFAARMKLNVSKAPLLLHSLMSAVPCHSVSVLKKHKSSTQCWTLHEMVIQILCIHSADFFTRFFITAAKVWIVLGCVGLGRTKRKGLSAGSWDRCTKSLEARGRVKK